MKLIPKLFIITYLRHSIQHQHPQWRLCHHRLSSIRFTSKYCKWSSFISNINNSISSWNCSYSKGRRISLCYFGEIEIECSSCKEWRSEWWCWCYRFERWVSFQMLSHVVFCLRVLNSIVFSYCDTVADPLPTLVSQKLPCQQVAMQQQQLRH